MPRGMQAKQRRKENKNIHKEITNALEGAVKAAREQVITLQKVQQIADEKAAEMGGGKLDTPLMWLPVFESIAKYGETGENDGIEDKIMAANEAATELLDTFRDNEEMQLESIAKYDISGCQEMEFTPDTTMKMKNEQAYMQVCNDMKSYFMEAHQLFRAIRYYNVMLRREGSICYPPPAPEVH